MWIRSLKLNPVSDIEWDFWVILSIYSCNNS
jgi:hypothetical protein